MSEKLSVVDRVPTFLDHGLPDILEQIPEFTQVSPTTLRALFIAPANWSGLGSIVHGGFQGIMLADMMDRVTKGLMNGGFITPKDLILRYHRPVPVANPVCIFGYLVEDRGQEIEIYGEIKDTANNLLTEAEGIFTRIEPKDPQIQTNEHVPESDLEPEFAPVAHWPTWSACCKGPLEKLCDLHVDWRLAPDRSALGGFLRFPAALCRMPPMGILAALFDQTLGLLGSLQGHGIMITIRLQITTYNLFPADEELTLLSRGYHSQSGPFKAQAWLRHKDAYVAEASGNFSVLNRGHTE